MLDMIFSIIAQWLVVLVISPFFMGTINKVKAFFAGKTGPSVFQPYFDLERLFRKQSVYSHSVSWVFRVAPAVSLAAMLSVSLLIPFGCFKAPIQFAGDIFLVIYLLALARFVMIIAALDTGFSMEGMGASREAFFSCLSEVALTMNFITLALLAHSISLSGMIGSEMPLSWPQMGPALLLVVVSLYIVLLAENGRIPVDDADTHLELTMIHEAMILDHSGVDLAFIMYSSAIKLFIFSALVIPIVIPLRTPNPFIDMVIFLGGVLGIVSLIGIIESSMARIRLNRVRVLLLISFALAFVGLIVALSRILQ